MEIKFKDVGYKSNLSYTSFTINSSTITGITGKNRNFITDMLEGKIYPMIGEVTINNILLDPDNINEIDRLVNIVRKNIDSKYEDCTVLHYIANVLDHCNYSTNSITTRIKDALKMVGLDESYLLRKINTLSTGEKKMMMIGTGFISNPKVLVLEEPVWGLDFDNKRKVLKLIKLLKEKYHKIIIISSNDSNFLYQYTDNVIIAEDCNNTKLYKTDEAYLNIDLLLSNNVEVPKLVKFTYNANLKGAKLHYHKDIRDLIKDIYKHV